jgi:hypothetical protein
VRGGAANNGAGVRGVSNFGLDTSDDGTGSGIGVEGRSGSGSGVRGVSQSGVGVSGGSPNFVGVQGASDFHVGVRGISVGFAGVVGVSTNYVGVYASNSAPGLTALYSENLSGNPIAGYFLGNVIVQGNFQVTGAKAAAVTLPDGSQAMMYCQESPEAWFEDFGRGQLIGGVARVAVEPEFASLVQLGSYMVFLTPEGECKGLRVSSRTPAAFEVRELQGGASSVPFTYRLVAKRKDIPGGRLARIDPQPARNVATMRQAGLAGLGRPSSALDPGPGGPSVPPFAPAPNAQSGPVPAPILPGAGVPRPGGPSSGSATSP